MINPLLYRVLSVQSESFDCAKMQDFIFDECVELGCDVEFDKAGNLYVTKGMSATYPCIASHMDTVHKILPDGEYMVIADDNIAIAYNPVKNDVTGVGGDDKVGIYIALQMLRELDYCKAVFFVDEEVGCAGSSEAHMDFFLDCRFVLQCDRKGNSDFIDNIFGTQLYGNDFHNAILPIITAHGYTETSGGLTDVYQLSENGIGIAVANMSCGYYNPHSDNEIVNLADVENCRRMVYEIMTQCTDYYGYKHTSKSYGHYDDWYKPYRADSWYDEKKNYAICYSCNEWVAEDEMEEGFCMGCINWHGEYGLTATKPIAKKVNYHQPKSKTNHKPSKSKKK